MVKDNEARLKQCDAGKLYPVATTLVMLPNSSPISVIPYKANPLVTTVHDVTFQNGVVTGWEYERGSEILEIVRLPVEIARSIVSIPTDLIQLRINQSSADNNLLVAQQLQIESELRLLALQRCIENNAETRNFDACIAVAE